MIKRIEETLLWVLLKNRFVWSEKEINLTIKNGKPNFPSFGYE